AARNRQLAAFGQRQVRVGADHVPRQFARGLRPRPPGAARSSRGEVDALSACAARPTGDARIGVARDLGRRAYEPVWRAMQAFTDARDEDTADEVWLVEHEPVFTLGQAGKPEHVLMPGEIPVIHVDRGGQVTYHGPGQIVAYPLLDLKRLKIGVRDYVCRIEQA